MPTTSTTNGAHVAVTLSTDPLTVIPDEPCHPDGRYFPQSIVRQMLQAVGIKVCADWVVSQFERRDRPTWSG